MANWNDDLALCYLMLGWYHICTKNFSKVGKVLDNAERILRPSGIVEKICRLDWVWALLAEAKGQYDEGLRRVHGALFTVADKGFRLWQADLLVLRGRLRLQKFQKENETTVIASPALVTEEIALSPLAPRNDYFSNLLEQVGDDGHETLKIAEQTGYIWPKLEALELLASYHQTRATLSNFNAQNEKEKAQNYTNEAESIKKKLYLTEEQMQELKAQARQEFEKQIAEWEK